MDLLGRFAKKLQPHVVFVTRLPGQGSWTFDDGAFAVIRVRFIDDVFGGQRRHTVFRQGPNDINSMMLKK